MRKLLIILVLVGVLLTSCGKVIMSDKVKVTFWHGLSGPLGDVLNQMITEFNRTHKDIEIVPNSVSSYNALSQKLIASIQARKQPDIAQVFESWTAKFIEADVLVNLSEFIAEDQEFQKSIDDIYPVFLKSNTYNGNVMSFPFNKSVRAYFYNKDAFYRAGLDPDYFPQTWDEFRKYCKLLTNPTPASGRATFGTNFNVNEWQFINLLHQAGGTIVAEDGRPLLNSVYGIEALTFITDIMHKDKTVYLVREYEGQNDFLAGIVAMYEGSSVSITHMRQQPINFNIGYAPLPTYRTSKSAVSGANIVVFKSGDKKREQAAWEFIKWFTDPEQTAYWSTKTSYMPVRRSAMQSETIQEFLTQYPSYRAIYEQLETAVFEPQTSAWFNVRLELKGYLEKALRGEISPREALDGANRMFIELQNR